ncbi:hypothetical protein NLU13_5042 [Sarocladium strictum]|uniref:Tetratricopeptide repeat protein n=1 Tax=Sarocladium strictum TaxID=5046 RepID=A0AA39GKU9_SARSR|nr:hypothetical protein NLU13_5042 [Sarocladium strictum]
MSTTEPTTKPAEAAAAPRFEWDFDVPDTLFWSGMELTVARNFFSCFRPDELKKMAFEDIESSPMADRLEYLLAQVQRKFDASQAEVAPEPLYAADFDTWRGLLLAIATCQKFLDRPLDEEKTIAKALENIQGRARFSWLGMMASLALRNGNYAAAEAAAQEVLPVWRTHEKLGPDSPQALGMTRTVIEAKWKQGGAKREEAGKLLDETFVLVEGLADSKFAKYQDEEREMLLDLKKQLETATGGG